MLQRLLLSIFVCLLWSANHVAEAQEARRLANSWLVSGKHCFAGRMVTPRVYLAVGPPKDDRWPIQLRRAGGFGPYSSGHREKIQLASGGSVFYRATLVLRSSEAADFQPDFTALQLRRLAQAPTVEFRAGGETHIYNVSGLSTALAEVDRCLSQKADVVETYFVPSWQHGRGLPSPRLSDRMQNEQPPTELFRRIAPSVYIVKAGRSASDILDGRGIGGSAVAVTETLLLTNCHVVKGYTTILVYPATAEKGSRRPLSAKTHSGDAKSDRCIIEVQGTVRPVDGIRPIDGVEIGERVYTIGSPRGLDNTLADGLVSGLRSHQGVKLVQTTAPISPGSSGGALVDSRGALLGITTFLIKDSQNLNFAIAAQEYWR